MPQGQNRSTSNLAICLPKSYSMDRQWCLESIYTLLLSQSILVFPTGRDSATFRDKGTEVPSLSRDKGTAGQAQNLATGRDGPGFWQAVPSRPGTGHGTTTFFFAIIVIPFWLNLNVLPLVLMVWQCVAKFPRKKYKIRFKNQKTKRKLVFP